MYSVYFTATLWDDTCGSEDDKRIECGALTGVKSYEDAMSKIENFYGDTLLKIEMEIFDTDMLIFTPEQGEEIHRIMEGKVW